MARTQLTVTIPAELGQYVENLVNETGETKSAVVSSALQEHKKHRLEALLREGYEEMAELNLQLVREFEHVDRTDPWPEY